MLLYYMKSGVVMGSHFNSSKIADKILQDDFDDDDIDEELSDNPSSSEDLFL